MVRKERMEWLLQPLLWLDGKGSRRFHCVVGAQHFGFRPDPIFEFRAIRSAALFIEFVGAAPDPVIEFGGLGFSCSFVDRRFHR